MTVRTCAGSPLCRIRASVSSLARRAVEALSVWSTDVSASKAAARVCGSAAEAM